MKAIYLFNFHIVLLCHLLIIQISVAVSNIYNS